MQETEETRVRSLEKDMATHSSIRAWRIPVDRGASWVTVPRVTKSQTWLSDFAHTATTRMKWKYDFYTQYYIGTYKGKASEKEFYITESPCGTPETYTIL